MKTKKIMMLMLLLVCFLFPYLSNAQPGFGDDVVDTPIDGGLSLVFAAGIGYGIKKIKQKKFKSQL